jgi:predicted phage tail protein
MYFAIVIFLMLAAPLGAIVIEHSFLQRAAPVMSLIGKWFVLWAVGVRLALAGLRQYFEPRAPGFHMNP